MGHFPGIIGADIPGQGPKLIVSIRRATPFRIDASGLAELTRPARERTEPVIPSGEFEFRTPAEVSKGLGLGYDAERSLEQAVRQWIAEPDLIHFRKSLYLSLRSFAPQNYALRNEIARRAQSLWKSSRGSAWSRQPGREGERDVVQKAEQLGLFGVSVSKPAPKTVGVAQKLADQAAETERLRNQPSPAERKRRVEAKLEQMRARAAAKAPAGFSPIPGSKHGGYHKKVGDHYAYWYPGLGETGRPHDDDAAAVPQVAPVPRATTITMGEEPPGGWRPEDKVPEDVKQRAREQLQRQQEAEAARRAAARTPEAIQAKQDQAINRLMRERDRMLGRKPQPAAPPVEEEWGWKRRAREAAQAAAEGPKLVVPTSKQEVEHGATTPGETTQGGAGPVRLVVPATGGAGPAGEVHGAGEAQAGGPAGTVTERIDELAKIPSAFDPALDSRPPVKPTPEARKVAITIAEQYLPPIQEPLPETSRTFPVPGPITNSQGEVVGHVTALYDHQKEGAERILQAWKERDGIILQDDAGLGKTNTALAALTAYNGLRNLIVVPTMNKDGLMKQWAGPLAGGLYGLQFKGAKDLFEGRGDKKTRVVEAGLGEGPGYYIVSYDELTIPAVDEKGEPIMEMVGKKQKPKRIPNPALQGQWDTITYDECHNMAGRDGQTGIAATAAKNLADKAGKVLYMSATPFTNIADMHYLTRLGRKLDPDPSERMFGNNPEEFAKWAEYVGAQRKGNVVKNPPSWIPKVRIAAKFHTAGMTVKRQASLEGMHSKFGQVTMESLSDEQKHVFKLADDIFEIGAQGLGETIMGMWKTNWSKAYWETLKIPAAVELAKAALAEGKQVALFTSYKAFNHAHLRKVPEKLIEIASKLEDSNAPGARGRAMQLMHAAREASALVDQLPHATDTVKQLTDAFGGSGQVAEIHGATSKKPAEEQKLYQEGRKRVAVCTQARGGTGISLHDTSGERPRVQINLSLPWSGRLFDQVAGRSHRLGSKSETTVHWLMGDADTERKMAGIVALRLQNQGSTCAGDPAIREDAGMLAAYENNDTGTDSDDEGADIKALEDLTEALAQDDEEQVLGDERLKDIRYAFEEHAKQLMEGRDLIGEAHLARVKRKEQEAALEHARAAEQIRAVKHWHVRATTKDGAPGYFIPWQSVRLPEDHPNYRDNPYSKEIRKTTSQQHFQISSIGGKMVRHGSMMGYFIPQESMPRLAERLGADKHKVDMRVVQAKQKAVEEKQAKLEAERAEKEKAAAEEKARIRASASVEDKARLALEERGIKAAPYTKNNEGEQLWHLTEKRPEVGDALTFMHRQHIKDQGGRFNEFPMHGGKGWTVKHSALPAIAAKLLGHEDWRKSLVIPDMPLDRLLERTRVKMMMQPTSKAGELIWCAEAAEDGFQVERRSPPGWRGFEAELLSKAQKQLGLFGSHPSMRSGSSTSGKQLGMFEGGGGKTGEGSRGGHVIGHYPDGSPRYADKPAAKPYGKHPLTGEAGPPRSHGEGWEPVEDSKHGGWKRRGEVIGHGPSGPVHHYDHWFPGGKEKQPGLFGKALVTELDSGYHGLEKGAGHKYIKRVPTGNVKRPWRYYYRLPSGEITSSTDIQQGSKFKVAHQGVEGHFEVMGHDQDKGLVHVRHDESQKEAHIRERDLHRMIQGYHAKKTQEAQAAAGEKPGAVLPRATIGHLGRGGYDEIHGFAGTAEELHKQAELMKKPDRDFAVIKQPGGFVLASKAKGTEAVDRGTPEQEKPRPGTPEHAEAQQQVQQHAARAQQIESKIKVVKIDPATGEEVEINAPKPAAAGQSEGKTEPAKPEPAKPKAEAEAPAPEERKTKLLLRAGKDEAGGKRLKAMPAEYVLMEAGDLVASHDPQSFEERADYPKGVQERRYHEVDSDRNKIDEIARNLEPALMVNTNPDAINGAPIITEDNVVLGGNGRTMGMQRAYAQYPEQAQQLKQYLARHARAFGHSSADVDKMKAPILVRKIKAGKDPQALGALGRRMNESLTQGLDPRSAEVALGKHYVNRELLDSLMHHMEPDERLSEFLNSSKSQPFVDQLERSGIIDQFNKGEFVDQDTGLLNEDGRHRVERVLAARIIPDASLLSKMNQRARESIAKAVPYLAQMEAKGWDIRKSIERAVRADIEQRHHKFYDAKDPKKGRELYLGQEESAALGGTGVKAAVLGDDVARAMFDVIQDHMGARKFPAAMKQVALEADRQQHDHGDQAAMFQREKVSPAEAIRHAFKLAGPKKSTAPAEETAAKPRKPRAKKPAAAPETAPEAPGPGWETPRRSEGSAVATPASEPSEAALAAQAAENQREYDRARGRVVEDEPPPPPPQDDRTLGMFAMAMPPATWRKADDGGLGRYAMHAITWEAKNLVRAAVGAAKPGEGIDGARVLKRLHQFVQEQTREDREFARAIGAHPVNDTTLRGLVQAAAHAHVSHLAKSLAVESLWMGWRKAVNA